MATKNTKNAKTGSTHTPNFNVGGSGSRPTLQQSTMSTPVQLARTPEPPYYAVIFTSLRTAGDRGYGDMAARMVELAAKQPGYLGVESARGADGLGITVSYWRDEASILAWKRDTEHQQAQRGGQQAWYADYQVRVAKVERAYGKL
jgi:heme-degrading monooxygenase HmoA